MRTARDSILPLICVVYCALSFSTPLPAADWPEFRGPGGQGIAKGTALVPANFGEKQNIRWKTPLPGKGWSSPVIGGNVIWMTTALAKEVTDEAERKKRLSGNTGSEPLSVVSEVTLRALAVDRNSGKLLHNIKLLTLKDPDPIHTLNSFASPTPILDDGKLYCAFGANGTVCLDTKSQKIVWTNEEIKILHENGPGSSPVLYGDYLISHYDGSDQQSIVAMHKQTGKIVWRTRRTGKMHENPQLKKAYGTPLIMRAGRRDVLLSPAANWLYAYDPATGKELWKVAYGALGFSIVARPVAADGMIYMCTCFMRSEMLAIRYDGSNNDAPHIVWRYNKQVPRMPSPLLVDGRIYFVEDRGVATCLDAKTGKELWKKRLGGNYAASPLYAGGNIYFSSRSGEVTVISPGEKYVELAKNKLDGAIMASPAAIGGALYIRTDKAMYRVEASGK